MFSDFGVESMDVLFCFVTVAVSLMESLLSSDDSGISFKCSFLLIALW